MLRLLILFMLLVFLIFLLVLFLLLLLKSSNLGLVLLRVFGGDQIDFEVLLDEVLEGDSTHSDSSEA